MNEWNWIDRLSELQSCGQCFALCTICNTQGSTPREIGAKMLVFPDGTIQGDANNVKLRYTTQFMEEAASGKITRK